MTSNILSQENYNKCNTMKLMQNEFSINDKYLEIRNNFNTVVNKDFNQETH